MSGNSSMSISFKKSTNKTNLSHNNRTMTERQKEKNSHIDYTRSDENIYLKQDDLKELYKEEFGEALENYNQKQKRNDRKIDSYYQHIKNSKKTALQQEMIIQVGDKDDALIDKNRELANEVLEDWFQDFEERNPNLKVYNAVIHNDEASPHLHLNFVPVASGYKRGLEKQVSFDRAIKQQDETLDKQRPFADWREKEVNLIADRLQELGVERKIVGTNNYQDVNDYKKRKDLEKEIAKLEKKITIKKEDLEILSEEPTISKDEVAHIKATYEVVEKEVPTGKKNFFGLGEEITEIEEVKTGNLLIKKDHFEELKIIIDNFFKIDAQRKTLNSLSSTKFFEELIEQVEIRNERIKLLEADNQNLLNEKTDLQEEVIGLNKENSSLKRVNRQLREQIGVLYDVTRNYIKELVDSDYAFKLRLSNFVGRVAKQVDQKLTNTTNFFQEFHDTYLKAEKEQARKSRLAKKDKKEEVHEDRSKKEKPMFSMKDINKRKTDYEKENRKVNRTKNSGRSR